MMIECVSEEVSDLPSPSPGEGWHTALEVFRRAEKRRGGWNKKGTAMHDVIRAITNEVADGVS